MAGRVAQAELVGLTLVVAAELEEEEAEARLAAAADALQLGGATMPMPRPTVASWALLIWLAECRAVTWPISWPTTIASSASESGA